MSGYRLSAKRNFAKVIALTFFVGALPFLQCASAHAHETDSISKRQRLADEFTYNAQAKIQAAYLWRGVYAGGSNIQASVNVGFYGWYVDMWWNVGVTDLTFKTFQPEVDFTVGFDRWGLNVFVYMVHNFDCGFFDFANYPDKGNRVEADIRYTISDKIPLTFMWATRIAGADCYLNDAGDIVRAWSSYAEISYNHHFRDGYSVYGAIGVTPWRGCYNDRGAALQNIEVRVRKDWTPTRHLGMMLQGQLAVSPMQKKHVINTNLTFGIYLIK